MITGDDLRGMATRLPEVLEQETWGHPTFRVDDKIFVGLSGLSDDETTARIKTSQQEQEELIAADPDTFRSPPTSASTAGPRPNSQPPTPTSYASSWTPRGGAPPPSGSSTSTDPGGEPGSELTLAR